MQYFWNITKPQTAKMAYNLHHISLNIPMEKLVKALTLFFPEGNNIKIEAIQKERFSTQNYFNKKLCMESVRCV